MATTWGALDGIPVCTGSATGPITAGLVVRAGVCDETLATHGIGHLIEHLLLSRIDLTPGTWNGLVDTQTTNFVVRGGPEEVRRFFDGIVEAIVRPPYERIPMEANVLKVEASGRGTSLLDQSARLRMGPRSYGLRSYREFFLEHPAPELVHRWLTQHYVRENAVIWASGPLPDDLSVALPSGSSVPLPPPTWLERRYPAFATTADPLLGVTGGTEWSPVVDLAWAAVEIHLRDALRTQRGLSYGVTGARELMDGDLLAHLSISADGVAESFSQVRDVMANELHVLSTIGPSPVVLEQARARLRPDADDEHDLGHPAAMARAHLLGRPFVSPADRVAVQQAATCEQVAAVLADVLQSALWLTPPEVQWSDPEVTQIREQSERVVDGQELISRRAEPLDERVVVAYDGISSVHDAGAHAITVTFDDVAAVLAHADGSRTFVGNDGLAVLFDAEQWQHADDITRYLDDRVAADRIVPLERPEEAPEDATASTDGDTGSRIHTQVTVGLTALLLTFGVAWWWTGARGVAIALFMLFVAGSLGGLVIERLPRRLDTPDPLNGDEFDSRPWSQVVGQPTRCARCGQASPAWANLAVVGWLTGDDRCRRCGLSAAGQRVAAPLAIAALSVGAVGLDAFGWRLPVLLWLVPVLVATTGINLRNNMMFTALIWPPLVVSVAMSIALSMNHHDVAPLGSAVVGSIVLSAPLFALWFISPKFVGFGLVRLSVLVGWTLGFVAGDVADAAKLAGVWLVVTIVVLSVAAASGRGRATPAAPSVLVATALCVSIAPYL